MRCDRESSLLPLPNGTYRASAIDIGSPALSWLHDRTALGVALTALKPV